MAWSPVVSGQYGGLGSLYTATNPLTGGSTLLAASGPIEYRGSTGPIVATPQATPVTPTFDPKIEANALYGKPMALFTGGYARMGASPAPIVGPYIHDGVVDFVVSFGVPSNPEGDRKIYAIWLDNELAWTSTTGGTVPGDGTFTAEPFEFVFKPGTLTQTPVSLETTKYPGDENAYRPQMLLEIIGVPYARFMANTNKPVPYVAVQVGDVSDGADPFDGINLGVALERIAFSPWAGYSAATFDSVGITDVVDAILLKDNFTITELCQSITHEYRNIDVLLSDKLRFRDRGNVVPDFVFDRDSIVGGDDALSVTRAGATQQKREHELITIDPDQDYTIVPSLAKIPREPFVISAAVGKDTATLPVVINAHTRQSLATFSQNYAENARKRVAFQVMASQYGIEPGDLFALTNIADGFENEVFKCTQTTHGANMVVDVEGEAILLCLFSYTTSDTSWLSHYESASFSAAQTFSIALGEAAADRVIVIAGAGTTNNRTVTSITIDTGSGAEAMTVHEQDLYAGLGGFNAITIYLASKSVPTGTTATVVVNYSGALDGSFIDVYRLTGLVDPTGPVGTAKHANATDGSGNPSTTIDVPSSGILIGVFAATDATYVGSVSNFGPVTWTGIGAEHTDEEITTGGGILWGSAASQSGMAAQTARTISATNIVVGRKAIVVGAWH